MTSIAAALPSASFAPQISVGERLSRLVFGSPSFAYACRDMRLRKAALKRQRAHDSTRKREVPVFSIDRKSWKGSERLPRIWLSEPNFDAATGQTIGRTFIEAYPHDPDPQGWHAYDLARKYFSEGLGYAPEGAAGTGSETSANAAYRSRRMRRDCFRAAELLYLHAARASNEAAKTGLGVLYRFDMCEGAYWSGLLEKRARHHRATDPHKRALALFEDCAAAGDVEALFHLGEMRAEGCACEADAEGGYTLFRQAFEKACANGQGELAGKSALHIADAHAQGAGAPHSFEEAYTWYAKAIEHLQDVFDAGEWHCKRQLVAARLGLACMDQELSGQY